MDENTGVCVADGGVLEADDEAEVIQLASPGVLTSNATMHPRLTPRVVIGCGRAEASDRVVPHHFRNAERAAVDTLIAAPPFPTSNFAERLTFGALYSPPLAGLVPIDTVTNVGT